LFGTPRFFSATLWSVTEPQIIQGRRIGALELAQVRQMMTDHPDWHRRRLSVHLASQWNWRNPAGQLKDMAARTFMLKLEQRGLITLPARLRTPPKRKGHQRMPGQEPPIPQQPLHQPLATLLPLLITEVSSSVGAPQRALFAALLHQQHYLSFQSSVGENLQYLVCDRKERPVACVLFGAAAWQCASRDQFVGWGASTRAQQLHLLTNNTRFLIPHWVRVPHLASYVLSRVAQRLSHDWQRKYGHPIYLLETFVQSDRFVGACYQASNWVRVGQTKGRSRQDRPDGAQQRVPIKDVYLYPLHPDFRDLLQGSSPSPKPSPTP
jgi:hypothetical protein